VTRNTINMPGEHGGSNWGGAAADPAAGWIYIRAHDAPSMHILSERRRIRVPEGATIEQRRRGSSYSTARVATARRCRRGLRSFRQS
jgi:quinoprotein glucose dehydrogenase